MVVELLSPRSRHPLVSFFEKCMGACGPRFHLLFNFGGSVLVLEPSHNYARRKPSQLKRVATVRSGSIIGSNCPALSGPLYPQQPTSRARPDLSVWCQKRKSAAYSMTSSARMKIDGDTVTPMEWATLLLIAISKRIGCSNGISAAFPPEKRRTIKSAVRRRNSPMSGP
jgi:hypothetical protein